MTVEAATPIRIAVIDTGFTEQKGYRQPILCRDGHKDFTTMRYSLVPPDSGNHGTNIAYTIANQIKHKNYCLVIIKYFDKDRSDSQNMASSIDAFEYASELGIEIINYSSSGGSFSFREARAIKTILNKGIKLVMAAGNHGEEVDTYPALLDDRIIVVGNGTKKARHPTSNYGKVVDRWEDGRNICSGGICLSGSSQSTAIVTGKLVNEWRIK